MLKNKSERAVKAESIHNIHSGAFPNVNCAKKRAHKIKPKENFKTLIKNQFINQIKSNQTKQSNLIAKEK